MAAATTITQTMCLSCCLLLTQLGCRPLPLRLMLRLVLCLRLGVCALLLLSGATSLGVALQAVVLVTAVPPVLQPFLCLTLRTMLVAVSVGPRLLLRHPPMLLVKPLEG